jgi:hypothetical protein
MSAASSGSEFSKVFFTASIIANTGSERDSAICL